MSRRIPSYRRYKPKDLGLVVLDGRQFYLGKYGSPESLAEYHRLLQEWMARDPTNHGGSSRTAPAAESATPTVAEVILAFWNHAQNHYRAPDGSPTGEAENFRDALRPVRRLYGHTLATQFGPLALRTVREEMIGTGLARTTINARINRIRRVFRWAASLEMIPVEVVQGLSTVPGLQEGRTQAPEPEAVAPVPIVDVEATLPHLPAAIAAMVRVQLATACRAGEVVRMRACDITRDGPIWEYRPATHKGSWRGKGRVVLLGPKAQAVVREYLNDVPEAYLFDPCRAAIAVGSSGGGGSPASRPTPGQPYLVRSYRQAVARACLRASAPHWSPLQLRHTAATEIRSRFGLEAAQVVLGHSRADVTQIYAERDLSRASSVIAEIG